MVILIWRRELKEVGKHSIQRKKNFWNKKAHPTRKTSYDNVTGKRRNVVWTSSTRVQA